MAIPIAVKWNKETYNVEADTSQPPAVFKFQLYSLTGVPPDRQKIMVKGGFLKDDSDWSKVGLKAGQKLMMMGTADKVPEAPKEAMVFMEDLPEDEQDVSGMGKYGAGLRNLGNTCYMNSTIQCLYRIPELRQSLQSLPLDAQNPGAFHPSAQRLAEGAKDLFATMEKSAEPVTPMSFLLRLRSLYPQFAQQQPPNSGEYMQQDAEECWTQLLYTLKETLQSPDQGATASRDPLLQQLMGVKLHSVMTCPESEESFAEDSAVFALKCNITIDVNHLSEGLHKGLEDDREKNSEQLGRLALFKGNSRITSLPPYLTVQLVRFFYKRDVQQKSKILRKVNFPLVLDCYEFCSDDYKKELDGPREAWQEVEDKKAGVEKQKKDAARKEADEKDKSRSKLGSKKTPMKKVQSTVPPAKSAPEGAAPSTGNGSIAAAVPAGPGPSTDPSKPAPETAAVMAGQAAQDVEMADAEQPSTSSAVDVAAHVGRLTGRYELIAVLTHKGRSADSGHYVSWTKQDDKKWIQFDDDEMIPRKEEEIVELSGGGDWHMAYLLLYKAIKVAPE